MGVNSIVSELVAGQLYALGGPIELDGKISWVPLKERGYQMVNCYLVVEKDQVTLVDTGLAIHRDLVLRQLQEVRPRSLPLSVFLTRPEYECFGNLAQIILSMPVEKLITGGLNNPFGEVDEETTPRGKWSRRVRLGSIAPGKSLPVGSSRLEVLAPPIRVLTTFWGFDPATKCLFTSDLFGHTLLKNSKDSRVIDSSSDDASTLDSVRDHMLYRFHWLAASDKAPQIIAHLDSIFSRYPVEMIAPVHGCVLVGRQVVERHYELVRGVLAEIAAGPRRVSKTVGESAPVASLKQATATSTASPAAESNRAFSSAATQGPLPREIASNIFWLGSCVEGSTFRIAGENFHTHLSCFLVRGPSRTVLVDTGQPSTWADIEAQLDTVLHGRSLDWIFPTHAEPPHSGNVGRLLAKFPQAKVIGDVRDYHLFFPGCESRLVPAALGDTLDLGEGYALTFVEAFFKDLPGTLWALEERQGVLFVSDGFGLGHREPGASLQDDDPLPVHLPGECTKLVSELSARPSVDQAFTSVMGSLHWTRFVDSEPLFEELLEMLITHSTKVIAPAHGYPIDEVESMLPLIREAHSRAFKGESMAAQRPAGWALSTTP